MKPQRHEEWCLGISNPTEFCMSIYGDMNRQRGASYDDLFSCCSRLFNQDTRMKYDKTIHRIKDFHNFNMAEMHRPPPRKLRLGAAGNWGGPKWLGSTTIRFWAVTLRTWGPKSCFEGADRDFIGTICQATGKSPVFLGKFIFGMVDLPLPRLIRGCIQAK